MSPLCRDRRDRHEGVASRLGFSPISGLFSYLGACFPRIRRYVTRMTRTKPLTNAERQRRWRDRRNALIEALTGSPAKAAEAIVAMLGVDKARKVAKALEQKATKGK